MNLGALLSEPVLRCSAFFNWKLLLSGVAVDLWDFRAIRKK